MTQAIPIEQLDRNFAALETTDDTVWYDLRDFPLEGRGWSDVESFYDRLPARARNVVRPEVWSLSRHSAGMVARFVARATSIAARWTLRPPDGALAMLHMPATGVSGLDLYGMTERGWRHAGNARPAVMPTNSVTITDSMPLVTREYLLYLPLYNGVESVHIGLPRGAQIARPARRPPGRDRPIVIYGTSVTQGGCASRPGMAWSAIVGRWLDRHVINLGFSGNGRMESEVGGFLAELDPCVYVIDCLGNMDAPQITQRTGPIVRQLRESRPDVPIVLLGNIPYQGMEFSEKNTARFQASNAALDLEFARLLTQGVNGLHLVPPQNFYGDDGEATVDGGHASDLGFLRIAQCVAPVLRSVA